MGWWNTASNGSMFEGIHDPNHYWGDGPADIMDEALSEIRVQFKDAFGREPTLSELLAGVRFSACLIETNDS